MPFDSEGNLLTETDSRGKVTTYTYDEFNQCTQVTGPDPDGSGGQSAPVAHYTYDDAGNVTSMTDPRQGVTTYEYDSLDRLTSVTLPDPDGSGGQSSPVTSYTYDAVGNLLTETDPRSNVTTYTYDNLNRRTSVTLPDPDGSGGQSAPVITYAYDAAGRLTSLTDPRGGGTSYYYDHLGRLTSVTEPDPDGSGGQSSPVTSYTYDGAGNLLTETDPRGNVTTYTYDNLNRRTQVTQPDPDGSGGQSAPVITYAYDAAGRMTSMTDPLGGVTTYAYDNLGRQTSVTQPDPDGSGGQSSPVTSYTYNAVGSLLTVTDPRSDVTEYTYDNLNRRTTVTDAEDGVTSYTYDAVGNLLTVTDPLSHVTSYVYDYLNRRTSVTDPEDGETTYAYDAAGNLVTVTDPLSHETSYEYDNLNRRTSVTDAETGVTTYTYDAAGNTRTLTDPELNATTWTYDALNRVTHETNELASSRLFEYDAAGNLTERTDRNGRVIQYVYDDLNRLTEELWKDGQTTVRTLSYTYNAASRMLTASDPAASCEYVYDNVGRATSVSATIDGLTPEVVLTQAFDAAGNRTSLAAEIGTPDDFLSEFTYDDLGRMTRVQQSGQTGGNSVAPKRVDFAYDAAGRFDSITRYANLAGTQLVAQTGYTYDDASRLTALTHSKGQTTLAGYSWTYDTKGRLTDYDSTIDGTADYTYDDTDQLTGADYSYQTDETYTYDANGNRTNTGYDTDPNNRLASDGVYNYEYDDEGNRTKRTNIASGAVTEYTWDYRNRLTKVLERASAQGPATKVTEYSYDVFDQRVGKDVDDDGDQDVDRGERYVYDGQHIALQFDGSDTLTHRHLFGPAVDQILADEDASGDVLWSLADHQGTVRDLAEYDSGQDETTVVNHVKYDAFGNITGQSNSSLTPHFAYTGREWDPDAGLYYYRARWYDPKTGRWLSEDPISFSAGDANLYRYVGNGPNFATDPTGLQDSGGSGGGANPPIIPAPAPAAAATVYSAPAVGGFGRHTSIQVEWDETRQVVEYQPQRVTVPGQPGVWMVFVRRTVQRQVHVVRTIELVRGPISGTGGSSSGDLLGSGPVLNAPGATWQIVYRPGYAQGRRIIEVNMRGQDARAIVTRIIDTAQTVGRESQQRGVHYYLLPTILHAGRPENTCNSVTWEIMTRAGIPMPPQLDAATVGWGNRFSDD